MLCLLVSCAFSFGAACCFRFIPVFWLHVFACIRFVFFPLGPRAVFTSVFVFGMYLVGVFFFFFLGTSVGFHFIWRDLVFLLISSCDISICKIFSSFIRVNVPFYGRASV